jgi:hypothetical protein
LSKICAFGVLQISDNIGPVSFISWEISMNVSVSTDMPSFVEKYTKIYNTRRYLSIPPDTYPRIDAEAANQNRCLPARFK